MSDQKRRSLRQIAKSRDFRMARRHRRAANQVWHGVETIRLLRNCATKQKKQCQQKTQSPQSTTTVSTTKKNVDSKIRSNSQQNQTKILSQRSQSKSTSQSKASIKHSNINDDRVVKSVAVSQKTLALWQSRGALIGESHPANFNVISQLIANRSITIKQSNKSSSSTTSTTTTMMRKKRKNVRFSSPKQQKKKRMFKKVFGHTTRPDSSFNVCICIFYIF